jgi:hypothetical protein
MSTTDIVLYFTINADGEYEVGTDANECEERFSENISNSGRCRTYRVEITEVELPNEEPTTIRVSMKSATQMVQTEKAASDGNS